MRCLIFFLFLLLTSLQLNAQEIELQKTIGGYGIDELSEIVQTPDGGFLIGGTSGSSIAYDKTEDNIGYDDYWIVKTDSLFNVEWDNTIGGDFWDELATIKVTADGGYILGGTSYSSASGDKTSDSYGQSDIWIVKTDSLGNIQWQQTIGGSQQDFCNSIEITSDGGYIVGATSISPISGNKTVDKFGSSDYWVIKLDSTGNIIWQNVYGGNSLENCASVKQTTDGGFIIAGTTFSNISGNKYVGNYGLADYWIIKTDLAGNMQWQRDFGANSSDTLIGIEQTNDGGYILAGYSSSQASGVKTENNKGSVNVWLVKVNSQGNFEWDRTIGTYSRDMPSVMYVVKPKCTFQSIT